MNSRILNVLTFLTLFYFVKAQTRPPIAYHIDVETKTPIFVKLETGQILIGNRKIATFYYPNEDEEERIIYEFLSLPFAEPPVGQLRFSKPVRLTNLFKTNVYNATFARPNCMQKGLAQSKMSEDCLYFNIWVPVTKDQDDLLYKSNSKLHSNNLANLKYISNGFLFDKLKPVPSDNDRKTTMFWIHGGSNLYGSSNDDIYDGNILASSENVIVASTNYRLAIFGFLFLNNTQAPGYAATFDQLLAIQWYKEKYLNFFGGLSKNLCLFGESAGANAISNLIHLDKNNLFNRVIPQSGAGLYDQPPDIRYEYANSLKYVKKSGCLPSDFSTKKPVPQEAINCLLNLDRKVLVNLENGPDWFPFVPVDKNRILNIDILVGSTQNEATMFIAEALVGEYFDKNEEVLNNKPGDTTKYDNSFSLEVIREYLSDESQIYADCVHNLYTNVNSVFLNDNYTGYNNYNLNTPTNLKMNSRNMAWQKIIKILSDQEYDCSAIDFRNRLNTSGKKFMYHLNKRPSYSDNPKWWGVAHADDLYPVFGVSFQYGSDIDRNDKILSALMMNYWANFAKNGKL
jgi:carboxylesterase type B